MAQKIFYEVVGHTPALDSNKKTSLGIFQNMGNAHIYANAIKSYYTNITIYERNGIYPIHKKSTISYPIEI